MKYRTPGTWGVPEDEDLFEIIGSGEDHQKKGRQPQGALRRVEDPKGTRKEVPRKGHGSPLTGQGREETTKATPGIHPSKHVRSARNGLDQGC